MVRGFPLAECGISLPDFRESAWTALPVPLGCADVHSWESGDAKDRSGAVRCEVQRTLEEGSVGLNSISQGGLRIPREEQAVLADRARRGDDEAFGYLYSAFRDAVKGFLSARLQDPDSAEDLCQDTFLLARKNLREGKFDPSYSFYTFLRNVASIVMKRHFADRKIRNRDRVSDLPDLPDQSASSGDVTHCCEMLRLLSVCCAKPHQIVAVGFVKYLEWRPREVATELGERSLGLLAQEFLESFFVTAAGVLDKASFEAYCAPLFQKLEGSPDLVYPEAEYSGKFHGLPDIFVKDLPLNLFFSNNPEASLSDWCDKVRRRAKSALHNGKVCHATDRGGAGTVHDAPRG